jgi:predicted nucleotidyltransferase
MQDIIEKEVGYLTSKYKAKTILLYGAFASLAANHQSDIDLIVLADTDAEGHDSNQIDNHILTCSHSGKNLIKLFLKSNLPIAHCK